MTRSTEQVVSEDASLTLLPRLAVRVGLNEAIVLQELHDWARLVSPETGWVYRAIIGWQEVFPFWSGHTIRRAFWSLTGQGLIEVRQVPGEPSGYRVVYAAVAALEKAR